MNPYINSKLMVVVFVIIAVFSWVLSDSGDQQSSQGDSTSIQNQSPSAAQGGQTAKSLWPYLSDETQNQRLSDNLLAKNIYVVFDGSGSMLASGCSGSVSKDNAAKAALRKFSSTAAQNAKLGLLVFDSKGVSERVSLQTGSRENFVQQVLSVVPGGNTPLSASMTMAFKKLTEQAKAQLGYGEYHLVVVTDGEASGGQDPTDIVNSILNTSPVIVHTIGFCIGKNHSLNQEGRILYKRADDTSALEKGLEGVLAEAPDFTVGEFK